MPLSRSAPPPARAPLRPLRELIFLAALALAYGAGLLAAARLRGPLALGAVAVLLGLLSVQAVLAMHDCMHGSLFGRGPLHALVGRLIGGFFLCPYSLLRALHLEHHRKAGLVDGDPEVLDFTAAHAARSPARGLLARVARGPLAALLFAPLLQALHLVEWLRGAPRRPGLWRAVALDLLVMLALWLPLASWAAERGALLRVLLVGLVLPFALGLSLTTLATLPLHTLTAGWNLEQLPRRARAFHVARTIESNRLLRALFFNLGYHLEHHLHPGVSRWELGGLARALRPALVHEARREGLPLLLHRGYIGWYRAHRSRAERFNPSIDISSFERANRRFGGVRPRGVAPQLEDEESFAPPRGAMRASPHVS